MRVTTQRKETEKYEKRQEVIERGGMKGKKQEEREK
jgi:hypothetical protein